MEALGYATEVQDPRLRKRVGWCFWAAVFCGVAPMVAGLGILGLYWLTDWDWLVEAGLWMLPTGMVFVIVGFSLAVTWLVRQLAMARRMGEKARWGKFVYLLMLFAGDFGAAIFCSVVGAALATEPKFTVVISNNSGAVLVADVDVPGHRQRFGAIASGEGEFYSVKSKYVTKLHIHLEQGAAAKEIDPALPVGIPGAMGTLEIGVKPGLKVDVGKVKVRAD